MDLVKFLSPKHAMLVHGEKPKMATLKERIESELGIKCYVPANGESVRIPSTNYLKANASGTFIRSCSNPNFKFSKSSLEDEPNIPPLQVTDDRVSEGILVKEKNKKAKIVHQDELLLLMGQEKHTLHSAYCFPVHVNDSEKDENRLCSSGDTVPYAHSSIEKIFARLSNEMAETNIQYLDDHLQIESFRVAACLKETCPYRVQESLQFSSGAAFLCCSWCVEDEELAWRIISILRIIE